MGWTFVWTTHAGGRVGIEHYRLAFSSLEFKSWRSALSGATLGKLFGVALAIRHRQ